MIRVALDSNLLVYLAGGERVAGDRAKRAMVRQTLDGLQDVAEFVVPVQVLGELHAVLRRMRWEPDRIATAVMAIRSISASPATRDAHIDTAMELTTRHRLQTWDAVIVAVAADSGACALLSEDMHDGFTWRGLVVINPLLLPVEGLRSRLLARP